MSSATNAVWVAGRHEEPDVTRLLIAFRDWFDSAQPTRASMATSVTHLLADSATEYLLGRPAIADAPCGICQLRFRHSVWTGALDCWLEDLFVEEDARGRGLGRTLVEFAFQRADARGATRIELDTNEDNPGAIALYESLGFSSSSKTHTTMRGRDIFMGRRLP